MDLEALTAAIDELVESATGVDGDDLRVLVRELFSGSRPIWSRRRASSTPGGPMPSTGREGDGPLAALGVPHAVRSGPPGW